MLPLLCKRPLESFPPTTTTVTDDNHRFGAHCDKAGQERRCLPLGSRVLVGKRIWTWLSTAITDPCWDDFLEKVAMGQFDQSSTWSWVKELQGWQTARVVFTTDAHELVAGFQILYRSLPVYGRFGYINKGPVLARGHRALAAYVMDWVKRSCRRFGILALLVHPPTEQVAEELRASDSGFLANRLIPYERSTIIVDLDKDLEKLFARLRKSTRKYVRRAGKNGVIVREGNEADIPLFFRLMVTTCRRRCVAPNPSGVEFLERLWQAGHPRGNTLLLVAEHQGEPLAALFLIPFGDTVRAWKIGWSGRKSAYRPNYLLHWEAIRWAKEHGFRYFDHYGLAQEAAQALAAGNPLPEELRKTTAFFKAGFGGRAVIYPPVQAYIANSWMRSCYAQLVLRTQPGFTLLEWLQTMRRRLKTAGE